MSPGLQSKSLHWLSKPLFVLGIRTDFLDGRVGELGVRTRQISPLLPQLVLSVSEAAALHEEAGGRLVRESTHGRDPIEHYAQLRHLRERDLLPSIHQWKLFFLMSCIIMGQH